MDEKAKIKEIEAWLNGKQDYSEGLNILQSVTKKWTLYSKLLRTRFKGGSKHSRMKLEHELRNAVHRLKYI